MKDAKLPLFVGLGLLFYIYYKAFTVVDENQSQFFAAVGLFTGLTVLKYCSRR